VSPRRWGSVDEAAMPEVVFELKTWKDDAARVLDRTVERVDTLEEAVRRFETQLASSTTAVKAVLWVLGLLWTATIALIGLWVAAHH
jgi:hypothetical protein